MNYEIFNLKQIKNKLIYYKRNMNANINVKSMTKRSFSAPRSLDQNVFEYIRFFFNKLTYTNKNTQKTYQNM